MKHIKLTGKQLPAKAAPGPYDPYQAKKDRIFAILGS
jgi:hypothetical protein